MKRFAGKPFVLLGVNSDENRAAVQELQKEGTVTWRSWWDGSTQGPIDRQWHVKSWPTIYLIDHQGVLRYRGPQGRTLDEIGRNLDAEIEKLVREAGKAPSS